MSHRHRRPGASFRSCALGALLAAAPGASAATCDVTAFGAVGDGRTLNTAAL
jgi:polygalacturonase